MNKYELAVVLSAKLEDEEKSSSNRKVQGYITRFGGTVTNVDEWGKKKLAYESTKCQRSLLLLYPVRGDSVCPNEVEAHVRIHGTSYQILNR